MRLMIVFSRGLLGRLINGYRVGKGIYSGPGNYLTPGGLQPPGTLTSLRIGDAAPQPSLGWGVAALQDCPPNAEAKEDGLRMDTRC